MFLNSFCQCSYVYIYMYMYIVYVYFNLLSGIILHYLYNLHLGSAAKFLLQIIFPVIEVRCAL